MTYILAAERAEDARQAFARYRQYLDANRARFAVAAYQLATSDWYFDPSERRCPHDGWLESAGFLESASGSGDDRRSLSLVVRLLGAYHDGHLELRYPQVFAYRFEGSNLAAGHRDWRYDELRVDADGRLEHEIEWWGAEATSRWLIVASDVELTWVPTVAP